MAESLLSYHESQSPILIDTTSYTSSSYTVDLRQIPSNSQNLLPLPSYNVDGTFDFIKISILPFDMVASTSGSIYNLQAVERYVVDVPYGTYDIYSHSNIVVNSKNTIISFPLQTIIEYRYSKHVNANNMHEIKINIFIAVQNGDWSSAYVTVNPITVIVDRYKI